MNGFRLTRLPDWPPALHRATDRYEQAIHAGSQARSAAEFTAAQDELEAAQRGYGAQCLALDKARHPAFYAAES